jgi:hypothetical protein
MSNSRFKDSKQTVNNMKPIRLVLLAATFFALSTGIAAARDVRLWSYQELLDNSDLAVIATPIANSGTNEHIDLPGFEGEHVVGVETKFAVSAVLKGDQPQKKIVLHHYRLADGSPRVPNGPTYVFFAPARQDDLFTKPAYLLFLTREGDSQFAPVVGQTDPAIGVRQLMHASGGEPTKISTQQLDDILKQRATIKPGMTREELSKVFYPGGGISTMKHRTYSYSTVPYIRVDVDFTIQDLKQTVEQPGDVVAKISKPYLEWSMDD